MELYSRKISLPYMKILDPVTGWFEIVKVSCFDLDESTVASSKLNSTSIHTILHCHALLEERLPCIAQNIFSVHSPCY